MITFIGMVIGTNLFADWFKKANEKYGATKIHIFVFIIALIMCAIDSLFHSNATYLTVLAKTGEVGTSAIALYEVLWKKITMPEITETDMQS